MADGGWHRLASNICRRGSEPVGQGLSARRPRAAVARRRSRTPRSCSLPGPAPGGGSFQPPAARPGHGGPGGGGAVGAAWPWRVGTRPFSGRRGWAAPDGGRAAASAPPTAAGSTVGYFRNFSRAAPTSLARSAKQGWALPCPSSSKMEPSSTSSVLSSSASSLNGSKLGRYGGCTCGRHARGPLTLARRGLRRRRRPGLAFRALSHPSGFSAQC